MDLLPHFSKTVGANFILYRLNPLEWKNFVDKLANEVRLCYIDNSELHRLCTQRNITKAEFLEKYIIPSKPVIKSGDFGEILCFFSVIENLRNKGLSVFAPKKWKWKDDKNTPCPCSDVVMFHIANSKKPTTQDKVITVESKMKAVNSKKHRIQNAIDDAAKDKLTRLAKSLSWLEEKFAKQGSEDQRKAVERFKDPATFGAYQKQHKAVAILDSALEAAEIAKPITNTHGIVVIFFSIYDLKKVYEDTRLNVFKSI
jgi:hypothetical protein